MNRKQKAILINFFVVIIVTSIAVAAMINLKDWVNRTESIRAMEHLSRLVLEYRQNHGFVPPESYVDAIKQDLEGSVRLGILHYRGRWIDFECPPDTILAYSQREYPSSLLEDGYVVLRLNGNVEWMGEEDFEKLLAQQQSQIEIEMMHK